MGFRFSNLLALLALILAGLTGFSTSLSELALVKVSTPDSYEVYSYGVWYGFEFELPNLPDYIEGWMMAVRGMYVGVLVALAGVVVTTRRLARQRRMWEVALGMEIITAAAAVFMLGRVADHLGGRVEFSLGAILYGIILSVSVLGWRVTMRDLTEYRRRKS